MVKVSIIIPCFNQGKYLKDSISSVLHQTYQDFEIIIVDDGSTDNKTQRIFQKISHPQIKVIHQKNMGLASARNTGILHAKGTYILPLDADDKIKNTFLEKTVPVLEKNPCVGIVGGKTKLFGIEQQVLECGYSFPEMLSQNFLQCTQLFRKKDWEKVGGYNPNMIYGFEDWDFWLSLIEAGYTVHKFDEILFFYRKRRESMLHGMTAKKIDLMHKQLIKNHPSLYKKYPSEKKKLLYKDNSFIRFLYQKKETKSGKIIIKICKIPVFHFKKEKN
jgi:glycosyltransferase involved in cell wall biosynthesis